MSNRLLLLLILLLSVFCPRKGMSASRFDNDSTEVVLSLDSIAFQELVVSRKKSPIEMKGDTLIFDVSGFHVPEGSKLRSLLECIPGIEVTHEGRIVAHGKEIVRIKLNGKDFYNENRELAINSLPVDVLCEVRLYTDYPDEEKYTGVHRTEGEQVLDVYTHPDRSSGWMLDLAGAGGNLKRYQAGATVSGFSPNLQGILASSSDNQPAVLGLGDSYLDKLSFQENTNEVRCQNYNGILHFFKGRWDVNATAFLNSGKTIAASRTNTEYYWGDPETYALGTDEKTSDTRSANITLDWIYRGKSFLWNTKTYLNFSDYEHDMNSLTETRERHQKNEDCDHEQETDRALNSNLYMNKGVLSGTNAGLTTSLNKSWGDRGDNLDFSVGVHYAGHEEDGFSHADIYYSNMDAVSRQVLQSNMQKRNLRTTFDGVLTVCPFPYFKFQLSYGLDGQYDEVDQDVHDLSYVFLDMMAGEGNVPVDSLNKEAYLVTWTHNICALAQYERNGWCLTAGMSVEPQYMKLHYVKANRLVDSTQTVLAFLPEIGVTYKKANRWNLNFHYRGRRKQPDLSYLLPVWDCTDPLHKYVGNSNLSPEINHMFSAGYFSFSPELQRQFNLAVNAALNQRMITQKTGFDAEKGIYTLMPVNVDGNWSTSCFWDFVTSFRRASRCMLEWKNAVSVSAENTFQMLRSEQGGSRDVRNRVGSVTTTHYGAFQYKYHFLTLKPYLYAMLASYRNNLQDNLNADLWLYGCGGLVRFDFDFGLGAGFDLYRNTRSGYWEEEMNGNEWICNFEIGYSFLKNRSLEVKLQGFDLFHQIHSIDQTNTVTFRRETINLKGINSYFMLSVSYHFDRFPNKS